MDRKGIIVASIFILALFISCGTPDNGRDGNEIENEIENEEKKEQIIGSSFIKKSSISKHSWSIPCVGDYYLSYSFSNSSISYSQGRKSSSIGSHKSGTLKYLDSDNTEFEYKWDGSVGGSEKREKILVVDDDILIVANGFECLNSNPARICFKDMSNYSDNTPFMGLGKVTYNNYSSWFVFTPGGNCYKRYFNIEQNDYLILCGTWTKESDSFKIHWENKKDSCYDLLQDTMLYQNYSEDVTVTPISLYVNNY